MAKLSSRPHVQGRALVLPQKMTSLGLTPDSVALNCRLVPPHQSFLGIWSRARAAVPPAPDSLYQITETTRSCSSHRAASTSQHFRNPRLRKDTAPAALSLCHRVHADFTADMTFRYTPPRVLWTRHRSARSLPALSARPVLTHPASRVCSYGLSYVIVQTCLIIHALGQFGQHRARQLDAVRTPI